MQNPDRRLLPDGCVTHYDEQRKQWYYIHLGTSPPRVTFIHPDDETPPSSSVSLTSSTPQSPQPKSPTSPLRIPSSTQNTNHVQQHWLSVSSPDQRSVPNSNGGIVAPTTMSNTFRQPVVLNQQIGSQYDTASSRRQSMLNPPQQLPAVLAPIQTNFQLQPINGNMTYQNGQITPPVQDNAPRQMRSGSFSSLYHTRQPSDAQNLYASSTSPTSTTQVPPDHSRFLTTSSNWRPQEADFDPAVLYSPTVSQFSLSSVPSNSNVASSQQFQPQRRHTDRDVTTHSSMTNQLRNQMGSLQASSAAQQTNSRGVLRRKAKTTTGIHPKPAEPVVNVQKPKDVPVYNMVANAPLKPNFQRTTPAFQTVMYSKAPLAPEPDSGYETVQSVRKPSQKKTLESQTNNDLAQMMAYNQASSRSTPMANLSPERLQKSQFASTSMHNLAQASMGSTTGQQSLSPLRPHNTGASVANGVVSPTSLMDNQALLHTMQSYAQLNPGLINAAATQKSLPNLPQIHEGARSEPTTSIPMYNQTQLPNRTSFAVPPATISPTLIPPQQPQIDTNYLNFLLAQNNMLAGQPSLPVLTPQQMNILANGQSGLPFVASPTSIQGGIPSQTPVMMPPVVRQQTEATTKENDETKKELKKAGWKMVKAVFRFGAKTGLQAVGVPGGIASAAANLTVAGAEAIAAKASSSKDK